MYKPAHVARWEARRLLALFTAVAAAMAMTLVFAGTAQAEHVDFVPHDGNAGTNDEPYWVAFGNAHDGVTNWACLKYNVSAEVGSFTVPEAPDGFEWRLIVVKQGTDNALFWDPLEDEDYTYPEEGSAPAGGFSHIILCWVPETVTTSSADTTSSTSSTSTTQPTTTTTQATTTTSVDQTTVTTADTTTTSTAATTTVSVEGTTVTTAATSTTATVAGTVVTTAPSSTVEDLPLTGMETGTLLGLGAALMGLGLALLAMTRRPQED
jgi:hypothetical protein